MYVLYLQIDTLDLGREPRVTVEASPADGEKFVCVRAGGVSLAFSIDEAAALRDRVAAALLERARIAVQAADDDGPCDVCSGECPRSCPCSCHASPEPRT